MGRGRRVQDEEEDDAVEVEEGDEMGAQLPPLRKKPRLEEWVLEQFGASVCMLAAA